MPFFRGADEIVIFYAEFLPQFLKTDHGFIAVVDRRHIARRRGFLHFLSVFVRSCQHVGILAEQSVKTGQDVRQNGRIGMPDMRFVIHIINRCRDIIIIHKRSLLSLILSLILPSI